MSKERFGPQQNPEPIKEVSKFPHVEVETRWMNRWVDDKLYKAHDDSDKPKFFILDMYPYPSGSGLHVGHVEGYTATDILSRYKRMNGFEVLHPMGWDAFGLPTENYAIQTGEDPHKVTADNANVFRKQCIRTGFSIDWDREIDTSKEEFYKWTQKIFLDLYEKGLAYKAESPVNWCTGCKTVIANEQVKDLHCERCDSSVVSKNIEQWFFKTTSYADRLLEDIDKLNWPEATKERQKNWIGKTEGIDVKLDLESSEANLDVFMSEPELLYGASFISIAPEHPILKKIVADDKKAEISDYVSIMIPQTIAERRKPNVTKGIFTGNYAINPINGEKIPIWIADYLLMDDNGGVKVGIPSESQKDKDFALAHELPITPVLENSPESESNRRLLIGKHKGEIQQEVRKKVLEYLGNRANPTTRYNLKDWLISRERYWGAPIPIVYCEKCGEQPIPMDQLPVILPKLDDFTPTGAPPLAKSEEFVHTTCPHCKGQAKRETKTLDTFVDSSWYFMRFADPHNEKTLGDKKLLNRWLPVDFYVGGADHATGHLLYARFITKVLHDLGEIDFDEPFTLLKHQGMILGTDGRKMSKRWKNSVNPIDVSNEYGSDALRLYEMFMGPLEQEKVWNTNAITGSRRFIDRVWQLQQKVQTESTPEEIRETNALIENITKNIESGRYNVAVSEFMKYINFIEKSGNMGKNSYETFLTLLSPFTPFIAEELWNRMGNKYSIHQSSWPKPTTVKEQIPTQNSIPITINGKLIGTIPIPEGIADAEEKVLSYIKTNEKFAGKIGDSAIKKVIYKRGKILNIVI